MMSSQSHSLRGYFYIAAAALCWGISASMGRAVFTGKLGPAAGPRIDPLILAQSRTTLSLLVLAPILWLRRGARGLSVAGRDLWFCVTLGVLGVAGSNYFYYLAIQRTNVATAIILQYTAPIWVLLYMLVRGRQQATWRRIGSVALVVAGSVLAVGVGTSGFKRDAMGIVAGALAALTFSYYSIGGQEVLKRYDRWRVLLSVLLGAAAFWQFLNPPWKIAALHYTGAQWAFLAAFAVTSVLLPFSLYFGGLQYLDATRAVVTSCLEPVFSIAIAALALGEWVGPVQVAGIVVVLAATILVQMPDSIARQAMPAVEPIE